ncbi:MAG: hypothetical protein PVI09_21690 [Anaerolineae bacterium]|jgi:hypothetical protein
MKTIFWLFEDYEQARTAVSVLLDKGLTEGNMNAIIGEEIAKRAMEINWEKAPVQVTDEVGRQTLQGLDRLLAGEQPVQLPGVGEVYAAGELATIVAKTASSTRGTDGGLRSALADFQVSSDKADAFRTGVMEGGLLFWVRVDDAKAPQALDVLQEYAPLEEAGHVV